MYHTKLYKLQVKLTCCHIKHTISFYFDKYARIFLFTWKSGFEIRILGLLRCLHWESYFLEPQLMVCSVSQTISAFIPYCKKLQCKCMDTLVMHPHLSFPRRSLGADWVHRVWARRRVWTLGRHIPLDLWTPCPEGHSQGGPERGLYSSRLSCMGPMTGLPECFYPMTPVNFSCSRHCFQQLL